MSTVALEFVPPVLERGAERAREEAGKVASLLASHGLADRINSLIIPGMIEEDPDRPVAFSQRLDPLDTWRAIRNTLPLNCIVTQVTAFHSEQRLIERFRKLRQAGIERAVCVGVPRTMRDGEGGGVPPMEAVARFRDEMPYRGVILIPTRQGESERFRYKLEQGADFAMCQLLYSDHVVPFLRELAGRTDRRPEILLSFGHIAKAEANKGLIRWLIKDEGNPLVEKEIAYVERLAGMPMELRRAELVAHYERVIDGVRDLGFRIGLHLECPYGFSDPAFETFAAMLDARSLRTLGNAG